MKWEKAASSRLLEAFALAALCIILSAAAGAPSIPLQITAETEFDGRSVAVHFSVKAPERIELIRFEWDLGNGRTSYRAETFWTYDTPGTYTVTLRAWDAGGAEYGGKVIIDVPYQGTAPVKTDSPHPAAIPTSLGRFITIDNVGDVFTIGKDGVTYKAERPGYFSMDAELDGKTVRCWIFVSPVDSRHSDRADLNWYRTLFNTGTQSNSGPAAAAMAYSWATGGYLPVSQVRNEIGWKGNGGTSFADLAKVLSAHEVTASPLKISAAKDLCDVIDRGNIAIVLLDSSVITCSKNPVVELFGRYYRDAVTTYAVVKGYSKDGKYLIVYDPIPSDWSSNGMRYADGISMIGRNRYYDAGEVVRALRGGDAMEILGSRPAAPPDPTGK